MNINSITPIAYNGVSQNKLQKGLKQIENIPLKDGSKATLRVADEGVEYFIKNNSGEVETKCLYPPKGLTSKRLWATYENIQAQVKEGFDFFKEFHKHILSRH